jgi:GntR family transcriptional repressor for pyruvate dehydrogenase complex
MSAILPLASRAFRPVRRSRVSEQIIEQVRDLITSGRLQPGDRLPAERELAQTLSASRSALREAICALESLGLLEVRPGQGTFLAARRQNRGSYAFAGPLRAWEHQHKLFEVRQAIEPDLAALAARRATSEQIEKLRAALADQEAQIQQGQTGIQADTTFHFLLADAAANGILFEIMRSLMDRLAQTREASLQNGGRPAQSLAQHQAILNAIEARDAKAAADRTLEHIQTMEEFSFLSMGLVEGGP